MPPTHEVTNQPPPLEGYDVFSTDKALVEGVQREGAGWALGWLKEIGVLTGGDAWQWGFQANRNPPVLKTHDRFGHRVDEVEFHPAWHSLMNAAVSAGMHALPWREPGKPGAHVARAAAAFTWSQAEAGHGCPLTMTFAAVPALRAQPELAEEWVPRLISKVYDPRFVPAAQKKGAIFGMGMTEKQGGSDVRANTTRAVPAGSARGPGAEYRLTGHKWFCSAPMSDGFLVLAQAEKGLSCFLLPRFLPDGTRNVFRIQRLKDKLGNRSNASSEVEFEDSWARMVGDEGRGVRTILEMVGHTRLDCVMGSASVMRAAVAQAAHHVSHRRAFGKRLAEQPLMQNVIADLAVETEAATALMLRLARAYDEAPKSDAARSFARLATAISKYWVCKRAPAVVYEALECLGGAGYVEESILPRLYRDAPLNSIWEGSGNVIALDTLRAMAKEPEAIPLLIAELTAAKGADAKLDAFLDGLAAALTTPPPESAARHLVERLAIALQASLLVRHAPAPVADAFVRTRLAGEHGMAFGTLPPGTDCAAILERARPAV